MFNYPIGQCPLKTDITARLFRLNPFVLKDFLTLGLEFPVERRILQQIVICR